MKTETVSINRRRAIAILAGAGATALLGPAGDQTVEAASCATATPAETEGPYFVEENLNRSDIRVDPSDGSVSPGLPLTLKIAISESATTGCSALAGARIEIWHCDAGGVYSDEAANRSSGKKYLRGYQIADENGIVNFTTVYPGWYQGRAVHIHFKVRTYSGATKLDEFTSQFFMDESITDQVFTQAPYSARGQRDTRNTTDSIFRGTTNSDRLLLNLTKTDQGYAATADVTVSLKTPTISKAVITSGGVVNAGSFQPGVAPGAWITIFGQNLATTSRAVATADLTNGILPTTMGGISVKINGQDAFLQYISPTQINVQAPADSGAGSVQVTVTNTAGTSDPVTTTLQSILPAFFASGGYVAAVRSDGTVITGTASTAAGTAQAAKPGDIVSLYGNGFGPTNPIVAPGAVAQTSAVLTNTATITIGGVSAAISFAGLSSTGLYQFNVAVPALANGDYPVVAQIAGLSTQSGVLLKIQS